SVPVPPRLLADDSTVEALVKKMAEQGGRMAIFSAEGSIFPTMMGRYSPKGTTPNIEPILSAWSGEDIRTDRMGREHRIKAPALTFGLCVQPAVIQGVTKDRYVAEKGLPARFLYAWPPRGSAKTFDGPSIPEIVQKDFHGQAKSLHAHLSGLAKPILMVLTP